MRVTMLGCPMQLPSWGMAHMKRLTLTVKGTPGVGWEHLMHAIRGFCREEHGAMGPLLAGREDRKFPETCIGMGLWVGRGGGWRQASCRIEENKVRAGGRDGHSMSVEQRVLFGWLIRGHVMNTYCMPGVGRIKRE